MSESENEDPKDPKIIVDTDWKEQVAREKASAEQTTPSEPDETVTEEASGSGKSDEGTQRADKTPSAEEIQSVNETPSVKQAQADDEAKQEFPPPPPASFEVLISMLFTQAMAMLGQMPDPASGESRTNKPYAKHYIDTLEMLEEKTSGNLKDEETKILSERFTPCG